MKYTLTNNLGEEKELKNLQDLKKYLQKPYTHWEGGTGDSAIKINPDESLIFFKIKEGFFIMQHPDYLAPLIKKDEINKITHYIGGQEMVISEKNICNEDLALNIFAEYINKGELLSLYEWEDFYS